VAKVGLFKSYYMRSDMVEKYNSAQYEG